MYYGNPFDAVKYLREGARLLLQPGLRRFVIVPLIVNLLVFVLVTAALISIYGGILSEAAMRSDWLRFLAWLLWIIFGLIVLIIYGYTFNLITTLIAAPFYGVLAEKIEEQITGQALPDEPIAKLVVRTFQRELIKLWYFVSRGILVLFTLAVFFFIPVLNLLSLPISALWAAWCMAVQYSDYSADNHKIPFKAMRAKLRDKPLTTYSMGGLITLGSMVPVINIFVMPVAVAGATVYWIKEGIKENEQKLHNNLPDKFNEINRI